MRFFNSGDLILPVTASAAVPVLVTPVPIGEEWYSDGGILNNFPTEPLAGKCDYLLGVSVNPISQEQRSVRTIRSVAERTYLLSIRDNAAHREQLCDWHIEPPGLYSFGLMDIRKADAIYEMGYVAAKEKLDALKAVLDRGPAPELPVNGPEATQN